MRGAPPLVGFVLMTWGSLCSAQADERPLLLLHYRAPIECPSGEDFTREVREVLGHPERAIRGTPTRVVIESGEDGAYRLALELPNGERKLSGAACEDVVRAAALFVALLLEDPEYQPATPPPPPPQRRKEPKPEKKPSSAPHPFVGARFGIDTGTLETLTPTLGGVAGLVWPSMFLELSGETGLAQETEIDESRTLRASFSSGGLRLCHRAVSTDLLSFGLCGGVSGGVVKAEGLELPEPHRKSVGFFDARLGAYLWVTPVSSLALGLDLEGVQPLLSPVVYFDGPGPEVLALKSRAGATARLGMRWIF